MTAIEHSEAQVIDLAICAYKAGEETVAGAEMGAGEINWADTAALLPGYLAQHGGNLAAAGAEMIALTYLAGRAAATERSITGEYPQGEAGPESYIVMCHELAEWLNQEPEDEEEESEPEDEETDEEEESEEDDDE